MIFYVIFVLSILYLTGYDVMFPLAVCGIIGGVAKTFLDLKNIMDKNKSGKEES